MLATLKYLIRIEVNTHKYDDKIIHKVIELELLKNFALPYQKPTERLLTMSGLQSGLMDPQPIPASKIGVFLSIW